VSFSTRVRGYGEVKVSSPRYVSFFLSYVIIVWVLHFCCTHDFISLCTRASLQACLVLRANSGCCLMYHITVSTPTPSGTRRDYLWRCNPPPRKAEGRHDAVYFCPPFYPSTDLINQHLVSIALSGRCFLHLVSHGTSLFRCVSQHCDSYSKMLEIWRHCGRIE